MILIWHVPSRFGACSDNLGFTSYREVIVVVVDVSGYDKFLECRVSLEDVVGAGDLENTLGWREHFAASVAHWPEVSSVLLLSHCSRQDKNRVKDISVGLSEGLRRLSRYLLVLEVGETVGVDETSGENGNSANNGEQKAGEHLDLDIKRHLVSLDFVVQNNVLSNCNSGSSQKLETVSQAVCIHYCWGVDTYSAP